MPRFSYSEVSNIRWADEAHTRIDCRVRFTNHPELKEPVDFTATNSDPGWEHSEEIFARAIAGEFGPIAEYQPRVLIERSKSEIESLREEVTALKSALARAGVVVGEMSSSKKQ